MAYPQNPDTALRTLGVSPTNLARTLQVQFVGEDRARLRSHPDLQVSVENLRAAFRWLSLNSWPFMEATKQHELWESSELHADVESILEQYAKTIGRTTGGVPAELIQGASRIPADRANVSACGPADCVAPHADANEDDQNNDAETTTGDQ